MVARVNTGKSISKALNYNEQKVKQGKAELLSASGFIKDADQLNFYDKLRCFEKYTSLNERTVTNTVHISLNFDPSEKLSKEQLVKIAEVYMGKIGLGDQPFLVYRHHDSGHPHIHIVTTNIKKDGERISMHNMGRNQSEKARKEIEIEFDLVKAESKTKYNSLMPIPVNAQKVIYGKSETKRAVANVLMVVVKQYKFSSFEELNAILKLYNVVAEKGSEESRMFQHKGLSYRVLDEDGNKTGIPVKASAFYMKPTLRNLEPLFEENKSAKLPHRRNFQAGIDWILSKQPGNMDTFIKELEKEKISVVLRRGRGGVIYGITYVDHKSRTVFNGSDLGREYSAKAILEKFKGPSITGQDMIVPQYSPEKNPEKSELPAPENPGVNIDVITKQTNGYTERGNQHKSTQQPFEYVPKELKKKKRKKRKRINL